MLLLHALLTASPPHPSTANCSVTWHTQPLDHFSFTETRTFEQRVFSYDAHWRRPTASTPAGPILFYCGNEASVELYVNATGWMWERAQDLGAMLVWAEHRYYGETQPLGAASSANASTLQWLSLERNELGEAGGWNAVESFMSERFCTSASPRAARCRRCCSGARK